MKKMITYTEIKKYAYVVFSSGHAEFLGIYTDAEYADKDIKRWQTVYDEVVPDYEVVHCILTDSIVPPEVLQEFCDRGLL